MYRIKDLQFDCRYFADGEPFKTKKEVMQQLAAYHSIDYTGVKKNGKPYKSIYRFLSTLKNDTERLNWLLGYGEWEIEEVTEGGN